MYALQMCGRRMPELFYSGTALLNALFVSRSLKNSIHKNSWRVNGVRIKLTEIHQLFHLCDHVVGGGGHQRIKISRGFAVNEISPAVPFPRFHKCELAPQSALHHVLPPIKFAGLFSLGNHGSHSSCREESR